jgi:hypothetical protein
MSSALLVVIEQDTGELALTTTGSIALESNGLAVFAPWIAM